MRIPSFHEWLRDRPDEALGATKLAMLVAQAGTAGVSRDDLTKALRLPPETVQEILGALVATGQVSVLRVGGELRYRATT
jgi:predicted ArsR family transcriptional regulator